MGIVPARVRRSKRLMIAAVGVTEPENDKAEKEHKEIQKETEKKLKKSGSTATDNIEWGGAFAAIKGDGSVVTW